MTPARSLLLAAAAALLLVLPSAAAAGAWVRAGAGASGLAMDDVNDADLSFYEDSVNGFGFPDVGVGVLTELGLGTRLTETLDLGFHWDRQWAGVSGRDGDVDATLDLDADAFMMRLQWRPLAAGAWRAGLVAGIGPLSCAGSTKIVAGNVNYGQGQLSGTTMAADAAVAVGRAVGGGLRLQAWAGRRWARIDEVQHDGRPALKDDGSRLSLDYGGWTARLGLVYALGD